MMKTTFFTSIVTLAMLGCNPHRHAEDFKSQKVSRTASFIANGDIHTVFPLFGAFEERKWESNWDPILVYPDQEIIEEGTTFKTNANGHGAESDYLWIVTKYDPESYLIQYLVTTENRFWTITVQCEPLGGDLKTETTVTYSFTSLNAFGGRLNIKALEKMYQYNLQDWKKALDNYLQKS